ncbi:hypothetical protein LOC68_28065 [Blastopirellula sp. JC732]|uniref:Uncharacterized protein n=1 Tax=Blastopirellula sediminis TaxID=2894196 RepID=A0A9X1MTM9_9BACT|nr:hypothetical protein [Blastopirellula sediminis]MCC9604434.1 hypothetical protein [Blastopirellula sediminis]MCC9632267.1 hypothetical protein [Blastopirellula sediminis]
MRTAWALLIVGFSLLIADTALAVPWEFDPYRIEVWIAADDPRLIEESAQQQLRERIEQRSWISAKAVWEVDALPCPADLRWDAFHNLSGLTQPVKPLAIEVPKDKIILVTIQSQGTQLELAARQFDVRTQRWSGVHRDQIGNIHLVSSVVVDLLRRCFEPIGQIERVDDKEALVVMKAQGLAETPDSPAVVPPGAALTVAMRRLNRVGQLEKNGVQTIDWTLLEVLEDQFHFKRCEIFSGFRRPLAGRKSIRVERLAVAVKPSHEQTELRLASRQGSPLPGYEIYAKQTRTGDSERLAETDEHGNIDLIQDPQHPFRLLYVRSGGSLLARLPVVPGLEPELTATVSDNARQIEAEGFVLGWRRKMLDVIARRELLADRIRRRMEEGDVAGAEMWLEELQKMTTINDLLYQFRQAKNDFLEGEASDPRTSAQISQLFDKAQQLASKNYNRNLERDLAEEVKQMRKSQDNFGGSSAAPISSDEFGK